MAAQAVDFTISGHVNRALVVVDSDDSVAFEGSKAGVVNNGSSSTRVRWTGSSEMMDGNSVGIQVEYQESGSSLSLRHANVHYAGEFGKVTIGQGSEAGDGSAYKGSVTTFGIGHGQEQGKGLFSGAARTAINSYFDHFGSLDAGTRTNMIRYDTPAIGPVGAAVSVGNEDRISLAATLSTEFSGSSFNAMIASLREDNKVNGDAQETVGASFGVSMANGLGISGAWAKGDNHDGKAGSAAGSKTEEGPCGTLSEGGRYSISTAVVPDDGPAENTCYVTVTPVAAMPAMPATDPSFFQAGIAYSFGDTTVSASWYNSEDFVREGSDGTAIGVGVNHNMPKVGAQVYAAVQGYSVEKTQGAESEDATVAVVGTRVRF